MWKRKARKSIWGIFANNSCKIYLQFPFVLEIRYNLSRFFVKSKQYGKFVKQKMWKRKARKSKRGFFANKTENFMQNVLFAISFRFRNPIKRSHRKEEIQYPFYVHIFFQLQPCFLSNIYESSNKNNPYCFLIFRKACF